MTSIYYILRITQLFTEVSIVLNYVFFNSVLLEKVKFITFFRRAQAEINYVEKIYDIKISIKYIKYINFYLI